MCYCNREELNQTPCSIYFFDFNFCFLLLLLLSSYMMACLREPCPPADGFKRKETNTSPPRGWTFQEMFCKTDGPFTLLPHRLSLSVFIKETGIQTQIRWFFGDTSLPSSQSADFPNEVAFLASAPRLRFIGLSCGEQSELGLSNTITRWR